MRVRCAFCGTEYESSVTRAGLGLVGRCERCGRTALRAVEDDDAAAGPASGGTAWEDRAARRSDAEP